MYTMTERYGLCFNGRRVPRNLHLLAHPDHLGQILIDVLMHWFRDDIDPERRALAIYKKSPDLLATRFIHDEWSCISDEELEEMIITILLRAHDERECFIEYMGGTRRDTLRLQ
jgi:hypothetical protein